MPTEQPTTGADGEVFRPAFPDLSDSDKPYTFVSYGLPFERSCQKHVNGFLDLQRVYIIASKSIASNSDNVKKLEQALGEKHVGTQLGIPAHTPYDSMIPIIEDVKEKRADCIVTLGGGSLADGAKLIAYATENNVSSVEDLIDLEKNFYTVTSEAQKGIGHAPTIKLIFVPTTLSGAEYTKYAGCTNPNTRLKVQFTHPGMYSRLLILDPDLCRTTPEWVWVSTGVRAIDHCVEMFCSPGARPESDQACERGLRRLVRSLLTYVEDPNDRDARLEAQLGCNNAMTGLILMVMCGASHGIGHMLGPLGVGHGQTSCILLPAVMKYNAVANAERQELIKSILWSEPEVAEVLERSLDKNASDAGDALRTIFDQLKMPRSLKDVGVGRDKWNQLAENSMGGLFIRTNPREINSPEQIKEILELCSGDVDA